MDEVDLVIPATRGDKTGSEYDANRAAVYVALPVHVADVILVDDQVDDRRRLVLKPILRLTAAGLAPVEIAEVMQLDRQVIKMALAEAEDLGATRDGVLTDTYMARLRHGTTSSAQSVAVFQFPGTALIGASDQAKSIFSHPDGTWSIEELGRSSPCWALRLPNLSSQRVGVSDVLRIRGQFVLSDPLSRLAGAVTVLNTVRQCHLLVPVIGRDGREIVAANPFRRGTSGSRVHGALTQILTELPSSAIGRLTDRLPDLSKSRSITFDLHQSFRELCADELRDVRTAATGPRYETRAAVADLAFAVVQWALVPTGELDQVATLLEDQPATEGALEALGNDLEWVRGNLGVSVTRVRRHLTAGERTCSSAVLLALLACRIQRRATGTDGPWGEEQALQKAAAADSALEDYLGSGDFGSVEVALTALVRSVGADRSARTREVSGG